MSLAQIIMNALKGTIKQLIVTYIYIYVYIYICIMDNGISGTFRDFGDSGTSEQL